MLFWCFGGIFILNLFGVNNTRIVIPVLFIMACVSVIKLPLRLNQSMYYFFFFYIGYTVGLSGMQLAKYATKRWILSAALLFGVVFSVFSYFIYGISEISQANKIGGDTIEYQAVADLYVSPSMSTDVFSCRCVTDIYIDKLFNCKR